MSRLLWIMLQWTYGCMFLSLVILVVKLPWFGHSHTAPSNWSLCPYDTPTSFFNTSLPSSIVRCSVPVSYLPCAFTPPFRDAWVWILICGSSQNWKISSPLFIYSSTQPFSSQSRPPPPPRKLWALLTVHLAKLKPLSLCSCLCLLLAGAGSF